MEDSHSGRVRTLGKRVKGNLSRVQIPHPPLLLAPDPANWVSGEEVDGSFGELNQIRVKRCALA